jgi:hypothetical protein
MQDMEDKANLLESLLERGEEFSKTSLDLLKLKALDKTSEVLSTIASRLIATIIFFMFFLFGTIGISLWLGEILGKSWYGFLVVAAFYGIVSIVVYCFLHNWLKKLAGDFIIKQVLK